MNEQNNNIAPTPTNAPIQNVPPVEQASVTQESTVTNVGQEVVTQQPVSTPQVEAVAPQVQNVVVEPSVQPVENIQPQAVEPVINTNTVSPVEAAPINTTVPQGNVSEPVVQQTVVTPQVETVAPQVLETPTVVQQPNQVVAQPTIQPQAVNNQAVVNTANQVPVDEFGNPTSVPLSPGASINSNNINTTGYNGMLDATSVGFVASDSSLPKKKNKGLIIGIVIALILVLAAVGYFVIYPFVVKTYFSDPKNVYETTIRTVLKNVSNTAGDIVKSKATYDVQVSLDTNVETLKLFSGYTYSANLGIDPETKTLQYGYLIKDEATVGHSYYNYLKDGNNYIRYSTYRDLIYTGAANLEQPALLSLTYQDLFDAASSANSEDVEYLINKITDLIVNGIDESKLIKEDASITVDGEVLKVTNNKYEFNETTMKYMEDSITNGLASDDKALEILAKMNKTTKDEIKKNLTEEKTTENDDTTINIEDDSDSSSNEVVYTNIYTYGLKNEIVGISITNKDSKDEVTYYNVKDYFEINYIYEETDFVTEKTILKTTKVIGRTQTGRTTVNISQDDKEIAKLNIKKWEPGQYEFDYEAIYKESTVKGIVKLVKESTDERLKYTLDFTSDNGSEHINVNLVFSEDWTSEIANINTGTAKTLNETELLERKNEFNTALTTTPIGTFIQTIAGFTSPGVGDYYENENMMTDPYEEFEVSE